jgi:hypothetical protein
MRVLHVKFLGNLSTSGTHLALQINKMFAKRLRQEKVAQKFRGQCNV